MDMFVPIRELCGRVGKFGAHFFLYRMYHDLRFPSVVLDAPFLFSFDDFVDSLDNALRGGEGIELSVVVDINVLVKEYHWIQGMPGELFQKPWRSKKGEFLWRMCVEIVLSLHFFVCHNEVEWS
jgi:hypothetical protein